MHKLHDFKGKDLSFKFIVLFNLFFIATFSTALISLVFISNTLHDDRESLIERFSTIKKQGAMLHKSRLNFILEDSSYEAVIANYIEVYNNLIEYKKTIVSSYNAYFFFNKMSSEFKVFVDKDFVYIFEFLNLNHYDLEKMDAIKNAEEHFEVLLSDDEYSKRRDLIRYELGLIHNSFLIELGKIEKKINNMAYLVLMLLIFTLFFLVSYIHKQGVYMYNMIWLPLSGLNEKINNNAPIKSISELERVDSNVRELARSLDRTFNDYSSKIQLLNKEKDNVSVALKEVSNNLEQRDIQISTIVHDLKTPLQSAFFGADIVDSMSKTESEKAILDIKSSLSYASRLINATYLLESSPDVDSSGVLYIYTLDFKNDIESILNNLLIKHNVDFKFIVSPNFPKGFTFQRHALYQVVINLLSNAIIHSKTNQVRLKFIYDISAKEVEIKIIDFGSGFKYDKTNSFNFPLDVKTRNGKGLKIINFLCDKYNIKLNIFSSLNRGTVASLTFLSNGDSDIATLSKVDKNRRTTNYSNELTLKNTTILIAEDFEPSRRMMAQLSKKHSLNTIFCQNGQEVLDVVEGNKVDILVLDLEMPKLSGIQVAKVLKRNEKTAHIPIFGFSADVSKEKEAQCLEAGMESLIAKPIDFQALIAIIGNYRKL